ncbi:MAG TPA: hypothetical protein VNZ22_02770, partial [Bacillota bacterium]|nr:hypothetical protein [Bacillota bacterium]
MKTRRSLGLTLSLGIGLFIGLAPRFGSAVRAQTLPPGQPINPATLTWPRFFATNNYEFAVYQPSIDQWPGNQLDGRLVVAVRPAGTSNETYGVVFFQARTDIDKVNRLVTLDDFRITRVNFPTQPQRQDQYAAMLRSLQQHTARVIPLDHLEAVFAASADAAKAKVQPVKNDPPQVIYTTEPSLLVLVEGKPVLRPLTGDYQRVVNTRPVLLYNASPAYRSYYLSAANRWYSAPALEGPWSPAQNLPPDLGGALDAALATKQVDPLKPKDPKAPLPPLHIYVSTTPAELLETSGAPNLVPIPNTELSYVANTSNAIFFDLDNSQYYVLISGRWFKAAALPGPYAFVPAGQLPADFQKIPADHLKSNALASVPGTPQAREAVIANSIPQTATVKRSQAKLQVEYVGAPDFTPIVGTPMAYAVNTATPVIQLNPHTY